MLRLASRPDIMEELYEEQKRVLGEDLPPLTYDDLAKLPIHNNVVRETLRLHSPIHSIMRAVTNPLPVPGTPYTIPTDHVLLSAPGVTSRVDQYFPEPMLWEPHRWDAGSKLVTLGDYKEEYEDYGYGSISKGAHSPYLPFGAGRHRCIGEQFAYLQLTTIVATMVREFKFKLPEGATVVETDYSSLFSRPMAKGADILWERRQRVKGQ
jgi:sterol 14-demethylase